MTKKLNFTIEIEYDDKRFMEFTPWLIKKCIEHEYEVDHNYECITIEVLEK